jgi:TPR repeat protein
MANRQELAIIRDARAGRVSAQLELGKLYLFGSAGLPQSLPTALHWLDRAAQQDCVEACELIGIHIPLELALQSGRPLAPWYERAYDSGVAQAGLVLAQLVLGHRADAAPDPACLAKALTALEAAARAGLPDAQWLLAQQQIVEQAQRAAAPPEGGLQAVADGRLDPANQRWLRRAADSGVAVAQFALLEADWEAGRWTGFMQRALPLARALVQAVDGGRKGRLAPEEVALLSRCARVVAGDQPGYQVDQGEIRRFCELAANEHDGYAQLAVGLWCARMQVDGRRVAVGTGSANFKKAIRWLMQAGEQGMAEAWYALSRIYIKPEFSQRNVIDAQKYLERAAELGCRDAQLECGNSAWRARRENESNDVRAVFWLQKAAAQGCTQAAAALRKIAPRGTGAGSTGTGSLAPGPALAGSHPLLAARLELAALFKLSRAEALLLDVAAADRGHCLVIDIRSSYGRSKRRLVLLETPHERQALDRIVRLFDNIDAGPGGPEGNYRQRLYRLRTLVPGAAAVQADGDAYQLAA